MARGRRRGAAGDPENIDKASARMLHIPGWARRCPTMAIKGWN